MGARCIPARTSPLPSHTPQQHVRHDHVRRPRGRQGFRDLQVRPRNEARRVRRAGFDPAPRLRVLHPPSRASSDDADIPASVARRRVAGACRPGADRIPLLRSSRIRRSARKVQSSKSRCAQRPLPSFPASARARSPPLRDATLATDGEAGYPADLAGGIARRDRCAPRRVRRGTAHRATVRIVRGRDGTRASSLPSPRSERTPSASKPTNASSVSSRKREDASSSSDFSRLFARGD